MVNLKDPVTPDTVTLYVKAVNELISNSHH